MSHMKCNCLLDKILIKATLFVFLVTFQKKAIRWTQNTFCKSQHGQTCPPSNQMDTKHMCKSQQGRIIYAYHPIRWTQNTCVNHNRDAHTYHPVRWTQNAYTYITKGTHMRTIQSDEHKTYAHHNRDTHTYHPVRWTQNT